jgi:hypothetical protein
MTYEFAKHVADNLRFGSYDGKYEIYYNDLIIKDTNRDLYINIHIGPSGKSDLVKKWYQPKPTKVNYEKGFTIWIKTGIISTNESLTCENFLRFESDEDYRFWEEFYTWAQAKIEERIYKHNCLIEDAFTL